MLNIFRSYRFMRLMAWTTALILFNFSIDVDDSSLCEEIKHSEFYALQERESFVELFTCLFLGEEASKSFPDNPFATTKAKIIKQLQINVPFDLQPKGGELILGNQQTLWVNEYSDPDGSMLSPPPRRA